MGSVLSGPKPPKVPEPDPAIEAAKKAELDRAEKERQAEIQKRLREETQLSQGAGSGRRSLLTGGNAGYSTRSLLGPNS